MTQPIHPVLERVADAIASEDDYDGSGDYYLRMARAAIQALLEPSDDMVDAGEGADGTVSATDIYRAMLLPLIGEGE